MAELQHPIAASWPPFKHLAFAALASLLLFSCGRASRNSAQVQASESTDTTTQQPMDSLKMEIKDELVMFIKQGFYSKEETFEIIQDMFYNETLDEPWVRNEISRLYDERLLEQKTWAPETDFDRLAKVFDKLNASGIIALHNAGYTRQDGEGDTRQLHEELKDKNINTRGYCFYHTQDMDGAIEGSNFFLAFGDFDEDPKAGTDIGKEIVQALHEAGFQTDWKGVIEERIRVTGFKWQKRFGNDNCSNERAIGILSKRNTRIG